DLIADTTVASPLGRKMIDHGLRVRNREELTQDRNVVPRRRTARRRETTPVAALAVADSVVEAGEATRREQDAEVSAVQVVDAQTLLFSSLDCREPPLDVLVCCVGLVPVARPAEDVVASVGQILKKFNEHVDVG